MTTLTRRSSAGRAVVVALVIPVVIAVVIVAVVVAAVVVGIKFSTSVPAREAAQKGQKTLAALPDSSAANSTAFAPVQAGKDSFGGLPPAVQATLRAARDFSRLSLEDMLKQAQTAKDLTRLTSDQYLRQNPNMAGYKPARGNGKTLAELKLTYLRFTTSFGGSCIVGVDKDSGLPVMAMGGSGGTGGSGRDRGGRGAGIGSPNGRVGPAANMGAGKP